MRFPFALVACLLLLITVRVDAQHRVLMQGNDKLAIVDADGMVEWEMKWGGIHDLHVLENGHFMVQRNMVEVVEIDPETKDVVWSYDSSKMNGNAGQRIEVHAFQPLPNGDVMIAESGRGRIIEVNRDGEVQKEFMLQLDNPHAHTDTRLARKLENGNYLVCHEADGKVREYDPDGNVLWSYEVPMFGKEPQGGHGLGAFGNKCFSAVRLESGNTLIGTGNGHSVLEVTPEKEIVWQIHQNDLPHVQLAWVTTLEVLPNGNYVIGNCHAGPHNPLLVEVDPATKEVVWQFDKFDLFGNSAPNSRILPPAEPRLLSIGDVAPPIAIAKWIKGNEVKSLDDGIVRVVEFWATWCGPCLQSMPHLSELQAEYGERVQFVGITDEDEETATAFLKRTAHDEKTWNDLIGYTLAIDDKGNTAVSYLDASGQPGIPSAFIVGRDGHIEWIGHPAVIDEPLAAVVNGSWDRVAERERYEQAELAARIRQQMMQRLSDAFTRQDWDAALGVIAEMEKKVPGDLRTKQMKMMILQTAGRHDELFELQTVTVEEIWDDAVGLNEIAWGIAASDGKKTDEALQLAMKAATRANELSGGEDGSVLDTLARVHYESGDLDTAIELQKKAAEFEPISQIIDTLQKYEAEKKARNAGT